MNQADWNKLSEYEKQCYNEGLRQAIGDNKAMPYVVGEGYRRTRAFKAGYKEGEDCCACRAKEIRREIEEQKRVSKERELESPTATPRENETLVERINRQVDHNQARESKFNHCLQNASNTTGKENAYWISEAKKYI